MLPRSQESRDVSLRKAIFPGDGEMARLMREYDWTATPLGAPEDWPQSLRTIVRVMLGSRFAMWMAWGPELTFLCNDAYSPTLGIKHPWALGQPASEVWAEIWADIGPRIESVLATGVATWDEALLLFLQRSGSPEETYHTFSYSPAADDSGSISGMLCVVSEETDRVIGERRLAFLRDLSTGLAVTNLEEEIFTVVRETIDARPQDLPFALIYLYDADGQVAELASAAGIRAGADGAPAVLDLKSDTLWPAREIRRSAKPIVVSDLSERMSEIPHGPWDIAPHQASVVAITQPGHEEPAGFLIAGINPYRPLDTDYVGFLDLLGGQIASALANARSYEAERRRAEELAKLDQAKTAFFSNVSHELRTPLTLMLGTLEDTLTHDAVDLSPRSRENLEVAQRNSLRLLKLVNTLLDFSRIEAGRVQAVFEPVDLGAFTAELVSNFRSAADQAGIALVVDCPHLSEPAYVDRDMWEKIVLNLVSNALKHTFEGEIQVSLTPVEDSFRLVVRDTGSGIPEEARSRLFERFFRVEGAHGRTYEGTGIGLSLVQELVRLHGGAVRVESEVGVGSTFTVSIPMGKGHLAPERVRESGSESVSGRYVRPFIEEALRWVPSHTGEISSEEILKGARIILADDNADLREYVGRLLSEHYDLEAVGDGQAALEAARRQRPDLIVTDVMMPRLDGFGLLRELRGDSELFDVPVIVLSARAGEEARVEGLAHGADDYLVKPFSASELLARVALHLRISREEHATREAQEALLRNLESERGKLRRIFAQAPAFIALLEGPDLVFRYMNEAYNGLIGYRDVVGKPIREGLPEVESQGFIQLLEEVRTTGIPYIGTEVSVKLQRSPGEPLEERFLDFVYQAVYESDGSISGVYAHGVDVTEQVRARLRMETINAELEGMVQVRTRELEHAMREMEGFNYSVSHDLRAPLRAIVATSRILLEEAGENISDEHRRLLDRQSQNAVRLGTLIDELLQFSRLARMPIERQDVDVTALAQEAAEELLTAGLDHGCTFDIQPGMTAKADSPLTKLVLANLMGNACKFSPNGGRITVRQEGNVFSVQDEGVGFEMQYAQRLFRPFERLVRDDEFPGTGIGLANVARIVERHHGKVWADSERGRGSIFSFTLAE